MGLHRRLNTLKFSGVVLATFLAVPYRLTMPSTPHLRPATPDEIADTPSFALRYEGRKRVHHADDTMARITADRLARHLETSGFVVMKAPPGVSPTTSNMLTPARNDPRRPHDGPK
jgi:hypothetical protein